MHIAIILFIIVALGIAGTLYVTGKQGETPQAQAPVVEATPTSTPAAETPAAQKYEDGTYSATGGYTSPAGQESVEVTLTLTDGLVTAANFKGNATHPTSKLNQEKFAQGYQVLVVGKPLDSINLTVVNGSSLAPKGFMDAVADIKVEAQS